MTSSTVSDLNLRAEEEKLYITKTIRYDVQHFIPSFFIYQDKYDLNSMDGRLCYICSYRFQNGDEMGLAYTDKGNLVICQKCVISLVVEHGLEDEYKKLRRADEHRIGELLF